MEHVARLQADALEIESCLVGPLEPLKLAVLALNQHVNRYLARGYLPLGYVNTFSPQQFGMKMNTWQKCTPTQNQLVTAIVQACKEILTAWKGELL
jgi:hypothetical protein